MKRKVRLGLDVYKQDLAAEKLAPEVEAIALGVRSSSTVVLRNWLSQGPRTPFLEPGLVLPAGEPWVWFPCNDREAAYRTSGESGNGYRMDCSRWALGGRPCLGPAADGRGHCRQASAPGIDCRGDLEKKTPEGHRAELNIDNP